jgi:hypothetical protein
MSTTAKPKKVRLQNRTVVLMRKRKMWRKRAIAAAFALVDHPTGAPGRDEKQMEISKCLRKINEWFGGQRARHVVLVVQRRVLHSKKPPA